MCLFGLSKSIPRIDESDMELFNYLRADIDAFRELFRFDPPCCCILAILDVLMLESP